MIFMGHYHVFPEGVLDRHNPRRGTLDELLEFMDELGIDKAAVFPGFEDSESRPFVTIDTNKWLYETLQSNRQKYRRIWGVVVVNPTRGYEAVQIVNEYIAKGFVGVEVHPPIMKFRVSDASLLGFYNAVEARRAPIWFHTGVFRHWKLSDYAPLLFDEIAYEHPQMPIIMAHAGGTAFVRQVIGVIQNNPNCYADISGYAISEEDLWFLVQNVSADRIIYGPDSHSADHIRRDIERIGSWDISEEDRGKILGGNLERLVKQVRH